MPLRLGHFDLDTHSVRQMDIMIGQKALWVGEQRRAERAVNPAARQGATKDFGQMSLDECDVAQVGAAAHKRKLVRSPDGRRLSCRLAERPEPRQSARQPARSLRFHLADPALVREPMNRPLLSTTAKNPISLEALGPILAYQRT